MEGTLRPELDEMRASIAALQAELHALRMSVASTSERDRLHKIEKVVRGWRHRHTSKAFDGWRDLVGSAHAARLAKAVGRWTHRLLGTVFDAWKVLRSRAGRVEELQQRAMRRIVHGFTSSAFGAWAEHVEAVRRFRQGLLTRAATRLAHRGVAIAFSQWADLVRSARQRREELYAHAARHLINHTAAAALDAWVRYVEGKREVLRRAAFAIGPGRLLAICFRTWRAEVHEAARARERTEVLGLLGEALPAMVREILPSILGGGSFGGGAGAGDLAALEVEVRRLRHDADAAAHQAEAARQRTLNGILRTWKHQHTSRAFDGWRDLVESHKELLRRSARHWANGILAAAWRRWAALVGEQAAMRDQAAKVAGRWRHRLAAAAFATWYDKVAEKVERRHELLAKTAGRWQNRALAAAFLPWVALTKRVLRAKELQRRALMRMVHSLMAAVFWAWAEYVSETLAHRQTLLAKTIGRTLNRPLADAFTQWLDLVRSARQRREELYAHAAATSSTTPPPPRSTHGSPLSAAAARRVTLCQLSSWACFCSWRHRLISARLDERAAMSSTASSASGCDG